MDRVSCPDTEIQVLPNLRIAVDRVSCPDTDIGVLTFRFPRASCFEKPMPSVSETTTNGMVQAWVGQKRPKRDILRLFLRSEVELWILFQQIQMQCNNLSIICYSYY